VAGLGYIFFFPLAPPSYIRLRKINGADRRRLTGAKQKLKVKGKSLPEAEDDEDHIKHSPNSTIPISVNSGCSSGHQLFDVGSKMWNNNEPTS
jgi:hypothetical protein